MRYYIQLTGDSGVMSGALKCENLSEAKEIAKGMSKLMTNPKTLTIYDDQNIERKQLYQYIKR